MKFAQAIVSAIQFHHRYGGQYGPTTIVKAKDSDSFSDVGPYFTIPSNFVAVMEIMNLEEFMGEEAGFVQFWNYDDLLIFAEAWVKRFGDTVIAEAEYAHNHRVSKESH